MAGQEPHLKYWQLGRILCQTARAYDEAVRYASHFNKLPNGEIEISHLTNHMIGLIVLSASMHSPAEIVDFTPPTPTSKTYYSNGFLISANRHLHVGGLGNGNSFAFDAGDPNEPVNPSYAGSFFPTDPLGSLGYLYIARTDGRTFTLNGYQPVSGAFSDYVSQIQASSGAFRPIAFEVPNQPGWQYQSFTGPEWTGLQWILFGTNYGANPNYLADLSVTVAVPEPDTWKFTIAGLILVGFFSWRRRCTGRRQRDAIA